MKQMTYQAPTFARSLSPRSGRRFAGTFPDHPVKVRTINSGWVSAMLVGLISLLTLVGGASAQDLPANFVSTVTSGGWDQPVGTTFSADGRRQYVWEKAGKVFILDWNAAANNYVKQATPLIDISQEVGNWRDYGMTGFVLHPDFQTNGYFYLSYVADWHHVKNFGTGAYNPNANEYFRATIARITRYTARASDGFRSVDLGSRAVLVGETASTGIPILHQSHGAGALIFSPDGTLLASTGDGASYEATDAGSNPETYYANGLADGIIQPKENVGSFRSQLLDSHNGKILRIDPLTGNGLSSNPFFDPAKPRSARSRVWAMGFRNPVRMSLRPGTSGHAPYEAKPGALYVGDVGWNAREELDVVTGPGQNFGWPVFEGMDYQEGYRNAAITLPNQDAPNPLFGTGGCNQQFFTYLDLLKQATPTPNPTFANPCNPAVAIPNSIPRFVHTRPAVDWQHNNDVARTGTFQGGNATTVDIGAAGSPVAGTTFRGICSVAGVWYYGDDFPAAYRNTYFHADYGDGWIKNFSFDAANAPTRVANFVGNQPGTISAAMSPLDSTLYYVNINSGQVTKITYGGNKPPTAVATADRYFGPSGFTVQFTGNRSRDPEGQPLRYEWNFGDGTPVSTAANPAHVFTAPSSSPIKRTVTLTVKDQANDVSTVSLAISVNNTPPRVRITSPVNNALYSMEDDVTRALTAEVTDTEHGASGLSYEWRTTLQHNTHQHPEPVDDNPTTSIVTSPIGCDGETYHFIIALKVTDAAGLSAVDTVRLYPDCDGFLNVRNLNAVTGNGLVNLTWNNPSARFDEIMVVAKAASGVTTKPSGNGSNYAANANFTGAGTAFNGGKVVYKGTSNAATVTGLTNGVTYYFRVFTRVGTTWSNGVEKTPVPTCPPATVQANTITFSAVGANSITLRWTNGNGNGRVVRMNTTGTFSDPADGTTPVANAAYAGSGEQVVFNGTAATVNVTGLSPGKTYFFKIYEFNCSGNTTVYLRSGTGNSANRATSRIEPVLTWAIPGNITQGTALGNGQLNATARFGGNPVAGSFSYNPPIGHVLPLGNGYPLTVIFNPTDQTTYGQIATTVPLNVVPTGPGTCSGGTVTREEWTGFAGTRIESIPVNTPPSSITQLTSFEGPINKAENYAARYRAYLCAPETGDYTFWIASDDNGDLYLSLDENPANKRTIAFLDGSTGPRGWDNSPTQKSALIRLEAGRKYYIEALHKEGAGDDNLAVGWRRPSMGANAAPVIIPGSVLASQPALVIKSNPTIDWASPAPIASGTALSGTQLNAVARFNGNAVAGTLSYSPASGTVLSVGNDQLLAVTFTPSNPTTYNAVSSQVKINVGNSGKTPATVNLSGLTRTYDGTAKAVTVSTIPAGLNTTVTYSGSANAPTNAGNYAVVATINDASYEGTSTGTLIINKATPTIAWSNPASISDGTPLGAAQLNATASVAGVFSYSPAAGTLLPVGNQTLSVNFAPTNSTNYNTTSTTVQITVTSSGPTACSSTGTGFILREQWNGVVGNQVSAIPVNTTPSSTTNPSMA
ncbi:MAG: PQQ-dependent sugar dehydrogenase, partial [Ferruginibacter sp.]|nr:PQQ-dependent sugar dehydrogenase [Cytophagales bacterium]